MPCLDLPALTAFYVVPCAAIARAKAHDEELDHHKDVPYPTQFAFSVRGIPMLILTRRIGETLCIGDDVTVTVMRIKGNQVLIGVNAPKAIPVDREEIAERKRNDRINGVTYRPRSPKHD